MPNGRLPRPQRYLARSARNETEDTHMARAIWTGSLSFGLVNIPIEVHTAVRDHRPHFRLLHAKDRAPINFERVCQKDGKTVAWTDVVKGYEYEKGRFVILAKEDFAAAAVEKTKRIDVLDFVEADAIDDRFFDKPYYLTPKKGGETAYALLREAMSDSGRIGIAKFILRETQHLAAVERIGDALVLSTLRFADELVDAESFHFPSSRNLKKAELNMAKMLVENLASEWDPGKYEDDYQVNLMRVIKAKMKGKEPHLIVDERPRDSNVVDLMERLRQSLDRSNGRRGAAGSRERAARNGRKKTRASGRSMRKTAVPARRQRRKGHAAA
jgi:DNA end-binding protein Ku